VAGLPQGVLVVDRAGRVVATNPAVRELLSLDETVEGRDLATALAALPPLAAVAARALAEPGRRAREVVQVTVAGEPRSLGVQWAPLGPLGDDPGDGVIFSLSDLEAELAAGRRERGRASLVGIGRFTNHVAHELKNPLGALKLYALLLSRQLGDARPEGQQLAEKVARTVDQLSAVVSEISGVGPPAALELAPTDLAGVADACLNAVDERVRSSGVEVVRRYDEAPVMVRGDARALRQAVLAFVQNALDAMPGGGTMTVGVTGAGDRDGELTVRDTGPGMPGTVRARLFEPFFTTRSEGIGLGLTIAGQVIEEHAGKIEVKSQPGSGTTVRVVLPAPKQAGDDGRGTHPGR
jgi:signal transduction histidine kinase